MTCPVNTSILSISRPPVPVKCNFAGCPFPEKACRSGISLFCPPVFRCALAKHIAWHKNADPCQGWYTTLHTVFCRQNRSDMSVCCRERFQQWSAWAGATQGQLSQLLRPTQMCIAWQPRPLQDSCENCRIASCLANAHPCAYIDLYSSPALAVQRCLTLSQ